PSAARIPIPVTVVDEAGVEVMFPGGVHKRDLRPGAAGRSRAVDIVAIASHRRSGAVGDGVNGAEGIRHGVICRPALLETDDVVNLLRVGEVSRHGAAACVEILEDTGAVEQIFGGAGGVDFLDS